MERDKEGREREWKMKGDKGIMGKGEEVEREEGEERGRKGERRRGEERGKRR